MKETLKCELAFLGKPPRVACLPLCGGRASSGLTVISDQGWSCVCLGLMLQSSGCPLQQSLGDSGQALLSPLLFPPALSSEARLSDGSSHSSHPRAFCLLACLLQFLLLCKKCEYCLVFGWHEW